MLKKGASPQKIAKIKAWIRRSYATNPDWQIFAMDSYWMCPFCGNMALEVGIHENVPEQIFYHLSRKCPSWTPELTAPNLTYDQLKQKAISIQIRYCLKKDPLWHMRDSRQVWYCPYCAKNTGIVYPAGEITEEFLDSAERHVTFCRFFDKGKGKPKTQAYLEKAIARAESFNRILDFVKRQLKSKSVWSARNHMGQWICPYCREAIPNIDISSGLLLTQTAPRLIAEHLADSCLSFQEKKELAQTVEELQMRQVSSSDVPLPSAKHDKDDREADSRLQLLELTEVPERAISTSPMSSPSAAKPTSVVTHPATPSPSPQTVPTMPAPPKVKGFEFEYLYLPCPVSKGDFIDFIEVDDHNIGILIGDLVEETPTPSALTNAVKKAVQIRSRWNPSARNTIILANNDICATSIGKGVHVKALYTVLDTQRYSLKCANTGHEPLILCNLTGNERPYLLDPAGMIMGFEKGKLFESSVEEAETQLMPGDVMLFFTDGVIKTKGPDDKRITIEDLISLVNKYGNKGPKHLLHAIRETLLRVRRHLPQEDDITLIAIYVR